jgi:hypothetical protein
MATCTARDDRMIKTRITELLGIICVAEFEEVAT